MFKDGVQPILRKYGYSCTNGSDMTRVTGWIEILLILRPLVPNVHDRRTILDWLNRSFVGSLNYYELGLKIDKANGMVTHNGNKYHFTPVFNV
jgi:hypothetical protein